MEDSCLLKLHVTIVPYCSLPVYHCHILHSLLTLPISNMICPLLCHISLPVLCAADATGTPWKAFYHYTPTPHGCSILLKVTDRNIRMGEYITLNYCYILVHVLYQYICIIYVLVHIYQYVYMYTYILVHVTWGEGSQTASRGLLTGSSKATNKKPRDSATCFQYTVARYTVSQVIE